MISRDIHNALSWRYNYLRPTEKGCEKLDYDLLQTKTKEICYESMFKTISFVDKYFKLETIH